MKEYDSNKKYKVECRAIMKKDVEVPGSEVERVKKEWKGKFKDRTDFQVYFMINEVLETKRSFEE